MKITFSNLCSHAFHQVKISPDGQYVANAVANRLVIRRSGEELPAIHVFECSRPINYIQWSPNSECILAVNYEFSRIEVHSIMDPKWTAHIRDPSFPIALAQWTADSKSILCTAEMGKEQRYINGVKFRDKCIETSPDGKYTAVIHKRSGKDALGIYHSASFISLQQFEVNTTDLDNMKWSPDSSCIAIWDNYLYHTLSVYRPDGYLCTTYNGYEHGLGIKTANWSQDGKLLAIGNYDQTQLFEETTFAKPQIPTLETVIAYQSIVKRPFNLPSLRLDYNQPNPKVGIGVCQFSKDGNYLASRNGKLQANSVM
ncbi:YVTN repeat-like/Quino protein amine dehydrogenase [Rhizopus microsporus var. microsporus]|uniref:YVTN repeat-like/Quino protein amine dehydrogenase n=1 Tax=Rhizopus microsporus var. microsporus TaxID=86635 RepID=A0A1X0QZJ3_RHIZD|nr:YVTN repeat-like/Quino protein amine dehydrogenase [Rhizopus microsporus var. microsporus]